MTPPITSLGDTQSKAYNLLQLVLTVVQRLAPPLPPPPPPPPTDANAGRQTRVK